MRNFFREGTDLRMQVKSIILDYMKSVPECALSAEGIRQAQIFKECGLDWGEQPKASSSNQQYWVVAILYELHEEALVRRDINTKKWRLM